MMKIWMEAFLKEKPNDSINTDNKLTFKDYIPSVILGSISILLGIFASQVFDFVNAAAQSLIDTSNYIDSVLN